MHVIELQNWDTRPDVLDEWQRLWSEQPGAPVFLHPIWARTWWRTFGKARRLRLLLVEEDGRAIALAPLFLERPLPGPGRLRIIGAGITSDYTDWLLPGDPERQARAVDAVFGYLARRGGWLTLELQGLQPDSRLFQHVERARDQGLLVRPRQGPHSPAVLVSGTWPEYLATRPNNLRKNIRWRHRRLAELGEVSFQHADAEAAKTAVDEAIHLHDLRWDGRDDVTLLSKKSARGRAFYRAVLPRMVREGVADLASLRLNNRAVATQIGFLIGGTYFAYQTAFDPSLSRYAPSTLLLVHLLEQAWADGLRSFDFMTGSETYKYLWATDNPVIAHVTILPNHPVARAMLRAMDLGRRLRSWRERRNGTKEEPATDE